MKQSIPNKITVTRLNYKEPTPQGGFYFLPKIDSLELITDINEVDSISFGFFYKKQEAEELKSMFPKTYKAGISSGYDFEENKGCDFENPFYCVHFRFNTFFHNGVTMEVNESAVSRRDKVIKKIKEIIQNS